MSEVKIAPDDSIKLANWPLSVRVMRSENRQAAEMKVRWRES